MSEHGTPAKDPDDRNRTRPEAPAEGEAGNGTTQEREHPQEPAEGGEDQT